ncbi:hypothetical protein A2U01_0049913, partial [Trifolium medium]|nr:hypothetical protein [Trifolium medium]
VGFWLGDAALVLGFHGFGSGVWFWFRLGDADVVW